jgi:Cd2+/Zn2+-exporting ATPase
MPVDRKEGGEVFGGTTNLSGAIDVRVSRIGEDTTLGKVKDLILQAEASRTPVTRIVDKYASRYLSVVLMITGIVWFFTRDFNRAVSLLVVACPCTLVLAMPTAMVAALTCAARLGILIKDVGMLQLAKELTAFVFDKTGTLTTGELSVTRMSPAPEVDGAELLSLVAAAEQMSRHPVAKAVLAMAHRAKLRPAQPDYFEEVAGNGVMAVVDGHRVLVGRRSWLAAEGINVNRARHSDEPEGLSLLYVASDGLLLGWIGLEDRIRTEARTAIEGLWTQKVREVAMITGDRWPVARRVAREVKCSQVQDEAFPADKVELVRTLRRQGHKVAVVGDGVNDAPALAAGDLSIAMGAAGSDIAINSANVALMNTDLRRLPFLIQLSREANKVVRQNLMVGIAGIVIFMVLAAMGFLTPIWSAVLHNVGILFVIFNSARLAGLGSHLYVRLEDPRTAVTKLERVDFCEAEPIGYSVGRPVSRRAYQGR